MKPSGITSRLVLIFVLTCTGFFLVYIPPHFITQYQQVKQLGQGYQILYFTVVGLGATLLLSVTLSIFFTLWKRSCKKRIRRAERSKNPSELSLAQQQQEIDENLSAVDDLQADNAFHRELEQTLAPLVENIRKKRAACQLEIIAFGNISSGKSSLLNALVGRDVFQTDLKGGTTLQRNHTKWPTDDQVILVDTPGLGEIDGEANAAIATDAAQNADVVLMVVDSPLRDSEFALLQRLAQMEKRILVCLNKSDWYHTPQRQSLLNQLRQQLNGLVHTADVVSVHSQSDQRMRTRIQSDGTETEETISESVDISSLAERLLSVVKQDGQDLLIANLLLQSRGLVEEARQKVAAALDSRAKACVDKYMWAAGSAAAVSPVPVLDLVAGSAVTTKMVLELARTYQQDVDLETIVSLLGQLGKNLIAIVGASAATPAIAAAVAALLKSVPGAGTIAGGMLQGIVQAITTRWIGLVFMGYFQNEMQQTEGGMASLARREWERVTALQELHKVVQIARNKFSSATMEDGD